MKKYLLALLLLFSLPAYAGHSVGNIDDSVPLERVTLSLDGNLYAWDGSGNVLPNWPIDLSSSQRNFILTPRLVDLDGDARLELLVVSQGEGNSLRLHVYNGLAQELARWSRDISVGDASLTATPFIADINGDNSQEIIFSADDGNVFAVGLGGNPLSGFPQNLGSPVQLTGDIRKIPEGFVQPLNSAVHKQNNCEHFKTMPLLLKPFQLGLAVIFRFSLFLF